MDDGITIKIDKSILQDKENGESWGSKLFIFCIAAGLVAWGVQLKNRVATVHGTVLRSNCSQIGNSIRCMCQVKYIHEGEKYTADVISRDFVTEGTIINLEINPSIPQRAELCCPKSYLPLFIIAIGTFGFLSGLMM